MSASYLVSAPAAAIKRRTTSLPWSSITALGIRVTGAAGLFLSHLVLVRGLGVTGFGEYAEAIAWLQVLVVLGKFGFDNTALRFVSEYSTTGKLTRLQGFMGYSLRVSLIASGVAMAILSLAAVFYRNQIGNQLASCLLVAAIMVPLISVRQILESTLRGVGRLVESQISTVIWPVLLSVLTCLTWLIIPDQLSSPVATLLHLISISLALALVYRFAHNNHLDQSQWEGDSSQRGVWMKTATAFLLAELLIGLKSRICVLMAGRLLGSDSAGLYAAMDRFAEVSILGSQSLGFVIAPQFASLYAAGQFVEMRRLMRHGSLLCLAFTLPVALAIVFGSEWIFQLMGPSYRQGWTLLMALLVSASIAVLSGPAAYLLQMTGHERTMLAITGLCAVTNLLSSLLLIGPLGIEGLGLAQILTSGVWTVSIRICISFHPAWQNPPMTLADQQKAQVIP